MPTLRVCAEPACPTLTAAGSRGGRCTTHRRAADKARGSREDRGYGSEHQAQSRHLKALVTAGHLVLCWRCGQRITEPDDLHLGHDDHDRNITRGPEHALCNLRAAGSQGVGDNPSATPNPHRW